MTTGAKSLSTSVKRHQVAFVVVDQKDARVRMGGASHLFMGSVMAGALSTQAALEVRLGFPDGRTRLRARPIHTRISASRRSMSTRLGDIVRSAGVEAFLTVALHRLGSHRDQRTSAMPVVARTRRIVS